MADTATTIIDAGEAQAMRHRKADGLPEHEVNAYTAAISSALALGDIDAAYERFESWLALETRRAQHGHSSNLCELVGTMLEMMSWMYERAFRAPEKLDG